MSLLWSSLKIVARGFGAALVVTFLCWTLVECAPGDVASRAAETAGVVSSGDTQLDPAIAKVLVMQVAKRHGLNRPYLLRSWRRISGVLQLNFGQSWRDGSSISGSLISSESARTVTMALVALLLAIVFGVGAAIASARHTEGIADQWWGGVSALTLSAPLPWLAMLVVEGFSYGHPFSIVSVGGGTILNYTLPVCLLAAGPGAVIWNHMRAELLVQSQSTWAQVARARGGSDSRLWKRMLPKSAAPVLLSLLPTLFAYSLAASVIVERVFVIDGMGEMVANAARTQDAPLLIAVAAGSAFLVSVMSSLGDVGARAIDKRKKSDGTR